jgi:hypothetical protein
MAADDPPHGGITAQTVGVAHVVVATKTAKNGLAACQKGLTVGFITAAALVHELIKAGDKKRLLRFQKQLVKYQLLIIDELGFVPLSKTGAELLFEVFSQRYERGSTLVTSNLPFDEWTEVFGSERLTGALLDRLTHQVHILEMNADPLTTADSNHIAPLARSVPVAGKRGFVRSTATWQPVSAESLNPAIESAHPAHARAQDPCDQRPDRVSGRDTFSRSSRRAILSSVIVFVS